MSFEAPGHQGSLPAYADIWRKGLIYTKRRPSEGGSTPYRVSAAFKCGPGVAPGKGGFRGLYRRVRSLAGRAIAEEAASRAEEMPAHNVLCQGWRKLGETNLMAAFIMLELRRPPFDGGSTVREFEPKEQEFLEPGGTSFEELTRVNPQHADDFYNEFDLTGGSAREPGLIMLSYGEGISTLGPFDFQPFVRRAEKRAELYRAFLLDQGEALVPEFRMIYEDWFLASEDFVTVQICFER